MYIVDVVGDKRVEGMKELLAPLVPGMRDVIVLDEGRLEDVSMMVNFMIDTGKTANPPNAVIVSAGIYDVLKIKTSATRSVGLRNIVEDYTPRLIGGIFEELVESAFLINPTVKVICCSIYGADLNAILIDPIVGNQAGANINFDNAPAAGVAPHALRAHLQAQPQLQVPVNPDYKAELIVDPTADIRRVVISRHSHQNRTEDFILQINKGLLDLNARFGVHTPYLDRVCHRYHPKSGDTYSYKGLVEGHLPSLEQKKKCARLITASLLKDSANW